MHAHADFNITILKATKDEQDKIAGWVGELDFENSEVSMGEDNISVNESYDVVFLDDVLNLAEELADLCPGSSFIIKGCTDTSESAGEYMDFEVSYENEVITIKWSDWYLIVYPNDYENFEEFSEAYGGRYDKKMFEELKNGGWYAIEREIRTPTKNELVREVPLDNESEEEYPFDI